MIIRVLKNIKHKLSKLKYDFKKELDFYLSIKRIDRRIRKKMKLKNNKISICFILQEYSIFDKLLDVFKELKEHDDVFVKAIVLPPYDIKINRINKDDNSGLDLFIDKIGKDSLITEEEFDKIEFDYIFINRPYDNYVEDKFRIVNLYKKSKICYISYASALIKSLTKLNIENEFNYYVNLYFADNMVIKNGLLNKYKTQTFLGTKKVLYEGYPVLEQYVNYSYCNSLKNNKIINLLYTPRWLNDGEYGGSSFMTIKNQILELSKINDIKIIFRPHPMMFDNLIKNKQMTEDEVENYRKALIDNGSMLYEEGLVLDILDEVDIVLTDYSSLIMNYYLTGKPIIYIDTKVVEFLDDYKFILDDNYVVDDNENIINSVRNVINEKDIKYESRIQRVIKESELNRGSVKRICDRIINK